MRGQVKGDNQNGPLLAVALTAQQLDISARVAAALDQRDDVIQVRVEGGILAAFLANWLLAELTFPSVTLEYLLVGELVAWHAELLGTPASHPCTVIFRVSPYPTAAIGIMSF